MKIDYTPFYKQLKGTALEPWIEVLPERIAHGLRYERHGLLPQWEKALAKLPNVDAKRGECQPTPSSHGRRSENCFPGRNYPVAYVASKKNRTNYFNPRESTAHISGNLPHWRQAGCMYFVTFRLSDSLPAGKLDIFRKEKEAWLLKNPEPSKETDAYFLWKDEYQRLFHARMDEWLDAGHGGCMLGCSSVRKTVENTLLHFDGERYRIDSFVVMPNHVHVLVAPLKDWFLSDIVKTWKSYSSHVIVKQFDAGAPVWQKEYFDHIVRSSETLEKFRNYIVENPKQVMHARDEDVASTNLSDKLPVASTAELKNEVRVAGESVEGLEELLKEFHPWRKGPYHIHGVDIDTEWRSDWKWDRVRPHLQPLDGRTVLDVGCGNGYHCWRMVGEGAKLVVGIDPSPMFVCQFFAMKNFIKDPRAWVLPLGIEDMPEAPSAFDTVFSMGVLYHRKSPIDHLLELKSFLRPGGELVIETLIVDGPEGHWLIPEGRYAKMRNVWAIPSTPTLEQWMKQSGLQNIRTVDVSATSTEEQRSTDWMTFESLPDFLDPENSELTVEGHPAPKRAVVIATA